MLRNFLTQFCLKSAGNYPTRILKLGDRSPYPPGSDAYSHGTVLSIREVKKRCVQLILPLHGDWSVVLYHNVLMLSAVRVRADGQLGGTRLAKFLVLTDSTAVGLTFRAVGTL